MQKYTSSLITHDIYYNTWHTGQHPCEGYCECLSSNPIQFVPILVFMIIITSYSVSVSILRIRACQLTPLAMHIACAPHVP